MSSSAPPGWAITGWASSLTAWRSRCKPVPPGSGSASFSAPGAKAHLTSSFKSSSAGAMTAYSKSISETTWPWCHSAFSRVRSPWLSTRSAAGRAFQKRSRASPSTSTWWEVSIPCCASRDALAAASSALEALNQARSRARPAAALISTLCTACTFCHNWRRAVVRASQSSSRQASPRFIPGISRERLHSYPSVTPVSTDRWIADLRRQEGSKLRFTPDFLLPLLHRQAQRQPARQPGGIGPTAGPFRRAEVDPAAGEDAGGDGSQALVGFRAAVLVGRCVSHVILGEAYYPLFPDHSASILDPLTDFAIARIFSPSVISYIYLRVFVFAPLLQILVYLSRSSKDIPTACQFSPFALFLSETILHRFAPHSPIRHAQIRGNKRASCPSDGMNSAFFHQGL